MTWQLEAVRPLPTLIMVSRQDHCLADLLFRHRTGALPIDLRAVVSNHQDVRSLVEWHGVPFHHMPVTPETKPDAEASLLELVHGEGVELVVLARYMQVTLGRSLRAARRPRHQHPPLVPAELQGCPAVRAGARARGQADRRERPTM